MTTPTPDPYRRDVLARTETMLAIYERRQTTKVPGTISLVRDLADEVRRLRVVDTRFIREDDDRCPECGGYGLRGCGAAWHDGKPDTHCSPACGCRDDDRSEVDAVRYKLSEVAGERDALAAEVAALRTDADAALGRLIDTWGHLGVVMKVLAGLTDNQAKGLLAAARGRVDLTPEALAEDASGTDAELMGGTEDTNRADT